MPRSAPNFSPFPFARLPRLARHEAVLETALASWLRARPERWPRLSKLVGSPIELRLVGVRSKSALAPATTALTLVDPHAALAEVRIAGDAIVVLGASAAVRRLAQSVLGGPDELPAPRALSSTETAIWCLAVATALEDLGVPGEVWPTTRAPADALVVELAAGSRALGPLTILALCPPHLVVRAPVARELPRWTFDLPVCVARSALPRAAAHALRVRDIVTVDRALELVLGDGGVGLRAVPGALEATVTTGYTRRDMAVLEDAHLELTVGLGTTRLSMRQLADLAPGAVIPLGRPLAGPYEVRAGGRLIGHGELVDVEGELGVRIVSLVQE